MGLVKDYAPTSEWIKADSLPDLPLSLTITDVSSQKWDDGREQAVLHFAETELKLGLNVTNTKKLAEMFGHEQADGTLDVDADELRGQCIALYKDMVNNKDGQRVPCVRIRAPRPARAATPAAPPQKVVQQQQSPAQAQKAHAAKLAAETAAAPAADMDDDPFADS